MPTPVAANRIGTMKPYQPPAHAKEIILRLDANEGPVPNQGMLDVLASITPDQLNRYPDTAALERTIALSLGIDPESVVITNGADDAIDRVCRALIERGRTAVLHTPTFEMIDRAVKLCEGTVIPVPWIDWDFPLSSMLDSINETTSLVSVVTPNNPTGRSVSPDDIATLAKQAGEVGALVMVDQAYGEFDEVDPYESLREMNNTVFLRTFSKSMGLAGIRVGYAIAPAQIAGWLRTVGGPYPVSSISLALAAEAFENSSTRSNLIQSIRSNRDELATQLISSGAKPIPSNANFILVEFDDASFVHKSLLALGISVRKYQQGSMLKDYLRITIPADQDQFDLLSNSLSSVLSNLSKITNRKSGTPAGTSNTIPGALT